MKKFFTLIATALLAMSANAQTTYSFSDEAWGGAQVLTADKTVGALTLRAGDGQDSKGNKNETWTIDANNKTIDGTKYTMRAKTGGSTNTNGCRSMAIYVTKNTTISVAACSSNTTDNRTVFIATEPGNNESAATVLEVLSTTVGSDPTVLSYNYTGEDATLYICVKGATNFYFVKTAEYTPGGDEGGDEGGDATSTVIASYNAGTSTGTWSVYNNTDLITEEKNYASLEFASKYNAKATNATVITFPSGYSKTVQEVVYVQSYVSVEGEFKAGDKVTIWPFTQMGDSDKATKYANIFLYDADGEKLAEMTNSASGALTVTNNDEAGDPKSFEYTLEGDYTGLRFGRQGNTRINLLKVTIERPAPTAVEAVQGVQEFKGSKVQKVIKNGKLYIGNYNVAGQQVK